MLVRGTGSVQSWDYTKMLKSQHKRVGGKLGLQISEPREFFKHNGLGEWHYRRSGEKSGVGQTRFTAQTALWALAALTSHKFQSLQVKTPIAMHSSTRPHPAHPLSSQLSQLIAVCWPGSIFFFQYQQSVQMFPTQVIQLFIDPLHLVSYSWQR